MMIPTEPIGSIPRPPELLAAISDAAPAGALYEAAVRATAAEFEATGSPVITDGEQGKYDNERELRRCLERGAHKVQIDFTEGRLAMKRDPSGELLNSFIDLNKLALARTTLKERA